MDPTNPLRILFVEDVPSDAELAEREIRKSGLEFTSKRVDTKDAFLRALEEFRPDVIVSDYSMPEFDGMQALKLSLQHDSTIPFILLTGSMNEETAVACMKAGASDYVIKEHMTRLPFAVKDALEQKKMRVARDEAGRALRESEQRYRTLVENANEAVVVVQDGLMKFINRSTMEMTGYSERELTEKPFPEFIHPDDRDMVVENYAKRIKGESAPLRYAFRVLTPDGIVRWVESSSAKFEWKGKPATVNLLTDITERKRAEQAFIESEAKYRTLVTQSPDGIFIVDLSGAFISANKAMCDNLRYSEEELLSMKIWDIVPQQYLSLHKNRLAALLKGESKKGSAEYEVKGKDGIAHFIEVLSAPYCKDKEIVGFQGIARDITERKRTEEKIRVLSKAIDSAYDSIVLVDINGNVTYANGSAIKTFGYSPEEMMKLNIAELGANPEIATKIVEEMKATGFWNGELFGIRKNRDTFPIMLSTSFLMDDEGHQIGMMGILRDITERKRAEEQITLLAHTLKSVMECVSITDLEDTILFVNEAFLVTYGYNEHELLGEKIKIVQSPNTPPELVREIRAATLAGGWQGELVNRRKDGREFPVSLSTSFVRDNTGRAIGLVGVSADITARKRAEEDLRRLLAWQEAIFEGSRDAVFISDSQSRFVAVNGAACDLTGYSRDELIKMRIPDLHDQMDLAAYESFHERILKGEKLLTESKILRKDRKKIYAEFNNTRMLISGKPFMHTTARDVSERKQVEEALRESEELFRTLASTSPSGIFVYQGEGFVYANERTLNLLGYSKEELLRLRLWDIVHPDFRDIVRTRSLARQGGENVPDRYEFKVIRKDGSELWIAFAAGRIEWKGRPAAIGTAFDITERKRAEENLKESEEKFRTLAEESPNMIFINRGGRIVYTNPKCRELMGYTESDFYSPEFKFLDLIAPEHVEMVRNGFTRHLKGDEVGPYEYSLVTKNGRQIDAILTTKLIIYENERSILGVVVDMTERKQAEVRFRSVWERSADGMRLINEEGRIVEVNEAYCRLVELPREEVVDQLFSKIYKRGGPDDDMQIYRDRFAAKTVVPHLQTSVTLWNGVVRELEISNSFIEPPGQERMVLSIFRDITERRHMEEALNMERSLLSALMDNIPDQIYFKDVDSRFVKINKALAERFGVSDPAQAVGKTDFDFFTPEHAQPAYENEQEIISTGQPLVDLEEKETWPDHPDSWVSTTKMPLRDEKGNVVGTFGISRVITERKEAEQRLEAERNLLRTIIDAIPDEIGVKDTERKFLVVNSGTVKAFKRASADELIGKKDEDLVPEYLVEDAIEEENAVLAVGGHSRDWVANKIDPETGEIERSQQVLKIPLKDHEGKIIGIVGVNRDITGLKRAEEMLEKERTLLLTLIESIPDEICLKDLRHRYLVANGASMKALGVASLKALIGKTDLDLVPTPLAQQHVDEEKAIIESGEPLINQEQTKLDPATGEIVKCALTTKVPVRDRTGKMIGILVVNRDITARKRAEEALRASEEKFRALFEESKDVVYVSTADGRLLDINPAGIELFGYGSKEESLQIDLGRHSYVDLKDKERFDREMEKVGFVKDFELVLRRKDGEKLVVLETATAVKDKTGKIVQYRGIMRDVTKQRLLERQFIQAQKMESIGTLAGGIAHDFNNILGIVLGHLSLLERTRGNDVQFKESVSSISKAVERGASLVRQILTFARKAETQLEPVSINGTVKELAKMLQETLPKTVVVELDLDKTIPIVSMDPTQLHQALLNLCVNARDAMDGQGTLKITTQLVKGDQVATRFPKARAKDYIRMSVADTGGGMDEETRRQIFEPFFTTKEKGRGTGLGLAVVYGVLQSHDGFIDVETALGVGTTFHLFIPVPEGILAVEQKQTGQPGDLPRGTETILVVEDEIVLEKLLSQLLALQGYKVYAAKDGEEAITVFGEHKDEIALVISDMGLPKRSGWAAFKMMKDQNPNIRVILASGFIDPAQKSEVLESGVKRFIHKPYRINEVLIAVRETLDAKE